MIWFFVAFIVFFFVFIFIFYSRYNNKINQSLGRRMLQLTIWRYSGEHTALTNAALEVQKVLIGPKTALMNAPLFKEEIVEKILDIASKNQLSINRYEIEDHVNFVANNINELSEFSVRSLR